MFLPSELWNLLSKFLLESEGRSCFLVWLGFKSSLRYVSFKFRPSLSSFFFIDLLMTWSKFSNANGLWERELSIFCCSVEFYAIGEFAALSEVKLSVCSHLLYWYYLRTCSPNLSVSGSVKNSDDPLTSYRFLLLLNTFLSLASNSILAFASIGDRKLWLFYCKMLWFILAYIKFLLALS